MSFEIEGTHTTKTMIWVCRIKTLGFTRKKCNLNGTWWNAGYPSFFRLHFVFLSSFFLFLFLSSFSSLFLFRSVLFLFLGAQEARKPKTKPIFHSTNFTSSLQNFYRIESFIYSHWQRLCTLLQKCPDDNSSGLNSIWFEPAWVRLKKLVQ